MVRATIQYPKTAKDADAKDIIGGQIADDTLVAINKKRFPVSSTGTNSSDIENFYILFTQKCDRKYQMAEEIVDAYHQKHPNGARLTVTRDRVVPGFDTIQTFGPYWTDGLRGRNSK